MVITNIKPILSSKYLFVKVETDCGTIGYGESGAWGFLEASAEAINRFATYLIGQDPLKIEHHWQFMYRAQHFRGAAIMGALSAIDIALWDIAGKYYKTPTCQLLGGKTRNKARVYAHVRGGTFEDLLESCDEAVDNGFTAIGHLNPFLDEDRNIPYAESNATMIRNASERIGFIRERYGTDIDLCVEIHRRLSVADAIVFAREIQKYLPFFYEDPIIPDNFDSMELVAKQIGIPIATGERLHTPQEFAMLIRRNAVSYVRTDVCLCGGLTGAKKIAAIAEANGIGVVPHNPLSPLSTAACIQLSACIPNFVIQELPSFENQPPKNLVVYTDVTYDGKGYLNVPTIPGIGARLTDQVEEIPFEPRKLISRLHLDGSVIDQ